jgi:ABC-type nitrate/sulfonate/bicarbonate transport system substrate-binding protein
MRSVARTLYPSRRLVVAGLMTCGALGGARGAEPVDITVALSSPSFSTVALRIADSIGLFAKYNIKPRFIVSESGNASTTAMLAGSAQVAISGPGEALAAVVRHQPLVIIGNGYRGLSAVTILSKAAVDRLKISSDAPVPDKLKALDGLVLASPSPTAIYGLSVKMAADSVGAKITFVYMGQAAMPAALEAGAVQGIVAGSPIWGIPVLKGTGVIWLDGPGGEIPNEFATNTSGSLQMNAEFVNAHPEVVQGLKQILRELAEFIKADPDKTKAILAKIYPSLDSKSLDLAYQKEWKNWTNPEFTAADVKHEIDVYKRSGLTLPGLDDVDPASMVR